ncbi:MAG TPA: dTDP-4-dehydrorhamnose reductase [Streptosporangiaceae bacterium]|nr:dTDP-4-dehydrorhamnose reductase [Streptosporangiaceae bacterium]
MSRWLVTGAGGMLGRDVVAALCGRGAVVVALTRGDLDVTDRAAVRAAVGCYRPDVVVNCAAWTDVDGAERDEAAALAVNGHGARNVAVACAEHRARLVQVSTDYVFAGDLGLPYREDARPEPRTSYGRTKLAGEQAALAELPGASLVLRTAWLYGGAGPSFVHTMIKLASQRPVVEVVADQRGQPTWTADVAEQMILLVTAGAHGIFHATSSGETTWFELAREVFALLGADPARVRPTTSEAFGRPASRPACSVLRHDRHVLAGVEPIGHWQTALRRAWPALGAPLSS